MSGHGKRHSEELAKVDREREYKPAEAVALVRSLAQRQVRRVRSRSTCAPG